MREEYRALLRSLRELGRPARISELREGLDVHDRTVRRWLLALCAEGVVEAIGAKKGRRYRLAPTQKAQAGALAETLDQMHAGVLREIIQDAVCGRTLSVLLVERARTMLPPPGRRGFARSILKNLETMNAAQAQSLGISPEAFQSWRSLPQSYENPYEQTSD